MSRLQIAELEGARKALFPSAISPMLASPTEKPFASDVWIFEPKLDGIRCLAAVQNGKVTLLSRRGLNMTHQYPALVASLEKCVDVDIILDGEIIALDEDCRPSFQLLQQRINLTKRTDIDRADARIPAYFFVFDVPFADGHSLSAVPLMQRKEVLKAFVSPSDHVRVLDHFEREGVAAYTACIDSGFEGIVAKRRDSRYEMGRRSPAWLKLKAQQTGDFIIVGYAAGQGWRSTTFGSLLLAYYDDGGKLIYAGSVGTGFDDKLIRELVSRFDPLITKKKNFAKPPEGKEAITWLIPELVAEIKFMDWTHGLHLRTPVFLRLRDDKAATDITYQATFGSVKVLEVAEAVGSTYVAVTAAAGAGAGAVVETEVPRVAELQLERRGDDRISSIIEQLGNKKETFNLFVGTETISLTTLKKEFWPAGDASPVVTKRDYLIYLATISPYLLPHLAGRPLTVVRAPNGVLKKPFFQKHWFDLPEFFETTGKVDVEGEDQEFLLCSNLATLLYLGQHSALELHTMGARVHGFQPGEGPAGEATSRTKPGEITNELLEYPDFLVLDLDVHEEGHKSKPATTAREAEFGWVCEVAQALREPLRAIGADPFVKVSGKGGLHLYVPIQRNLDYDHARVISETLGQHATKLKPHLATTAFKVEARVGKVYVDTSSNIHRKTMIAPYSPRLTALGTVSMPVKWNELDAGKWIPCRMSDAVQRLKTQGDLWENILKSRIDMHRSISGANKA